MLDRRNFLRVAGAVSANALAGAKIHALTTQQSAPRPVSANDHVQVALIGAGGQGQYDMTSMLQVPGVKLVAVADCYQGRLDHSKELWGEDIFTTRDYREVLTRSDIDAVLVGVPDHWHKQISIEAMEQGKDVYCEKPMIHQYSDGPAMIQTSKQSGRILQIGSQRVSSILYAKAKELLASGIIGQLNMVSAHWDRNSSVGAWNYTVPPDASETTCDWVRFEGTAPKRPFSGERFFQWRKWRDYGTGVAGDLFVHLFSGTHFVTGLHGPVRGMATGGIRYWRDGRDAADVVLGLFDYKGGSALSKEGFNLNVRVNFVDGGEESEGLVFTGSEGTLEIDGHSVTVSRVPREKQPGLMMNSLSEAMQRQILHDYRQKYPLEHPQGPPPVSVEKYVAPDGYSDSYDHMHNFISSVRSREPVVEDAVFGYRAAGAALLANLSMERGAPVKWDPEAMKLVD